MASPFPASSIERGLSTPLPRTSTPRRWSLCSNSSHDHPFHSAGSPVAPRHGPLERQVPPRTRQGPPACRWSRVARHARAAHPPAPGGQQALRGRPVDLEEKELRPGRASSRSPPPDLLSLQDEDRDLAKVSKRHRARTQSLRGVSGPDSASESGPPAATDRLTTSFLKYSIRKP